MPYERRAHQRVPTKLTIRWEGLLTNNSDLENLTVSVLEACDSPVDVRSLRSLDISRLSVCSPSTSSNPLQTIA
jgi:hypothetical protein